MGPTLILLVSVGPEPASRPHTHTQPAAATRGRKAGLWQSPRCPATDPLWDRGNPVCRVSAFLRRPFSMGRSPAQRRMIGSAVLSADLGSLLAPVLAPGDLGGPRAGPLKLLRPAQNRPEIETSSRKVLLAFHDKVPRSGERGIPATNSQMILAREACSSDCKPTVRRRRLFPFARPPTTVVFCSGFESSFVFSS